MNNIFKNCRPKEKEESVMSALLVFSSFCLASGFLQNLTLCYELGKDDTESFIWQMLPESVTLLMMSFCSVLILLILRNVKRKQVFTQQNANLINAIGCLIAADGGLLLLLKNFGVENSLCHTYLIFIMLGLFFSFISYVFKAGIRMKEEQELTI